MTILKCRNKIWIENICDLFCDFKILPIGCQTLEMQMNAITRFVLLVFIIILLLFDLKKSLIFLSISLLLIIIIYYILKNKMEHYENFTPTQPHRNPKMYAQGSNGFAANNRAAIQKNPRGDSIILNRPTAFRFCNDEVEYDFNDISPNNVNTNPKMNNEYMSQNQKLVGGPNPKTLIAPVIVPPSHDLSYWKTNNLITHSHVNDMKQIDNYQSGYQVSTCCGDEHIGVQWDKPGTDRLLRNNNYKTGYQYKKNNYEDNKMFTRPDDKIIKENFTMDRIAPVFEIKPNQSGQVNISCGYNPEQLYQAGLPTNYPSGNCEKDPIFKRYNEDLFTQTIQPGTYTTNQVNEPINSNIGISFNQQFEPLTSRVTNNGDLLFTEHDPQIFDPEIIEDVEETVNESNVYDPRFSGYGTSYRSYTDDLVGQTRFYYDDINSIRMPNYVTRSKIDFLPYADTYGPMINQTGNNHNSTIRQLANDSWNKNSIDFRTDLQQSLMRKINANGWQQRQAPISTNGQRMLGGTR
jgi:hypothetical protein